MITGKNKEQFEKWFVKNYDTEFMPDNEFSRYIWFIKQPFEMQIGVYLAYYDSLNVYIEICKTRKYWYFMINDSSDEYDNNNSFKTRNEALKEAFKKAEWNKTLASKKLGITQPTLNSKIIKHNIVNESIC